MNIVCVSINESYLQDFNIRALFSPYHPTHVKAPILVLFTLKQATAVTFHTAMTAFGEQPSVVVATAGGSLVKCNSDAWMAAAAAARGDGEEDGTAGAGEEVLSYVCRFEVDGGCSFRVALVRRVFGRRRAKGLR